MQTIAKSIFTSLLKAGATKKTIAVVTEDYVRTVLDSMINERKQRQDAVLRPSSQHSDMMAPKEMIQAPLPPQRAARTSSAISTSEAETHQFAAEDVTPVVIANEIKRDSGVSDTVWEQLQHDKQAAKKREEQYQNFMKASTDAANDAKALQQKQFASEEAFQQAIKDNHDQLVLQEAKRLREEARLRHEIERRAQAERLAELESLRKIVEEERRKEAKAQQLLKTLGRCVMGYRWIKQNGGYRCSAGGHFVSDSELAL